MKCPKCGYISFDYNEVCPKCNKAISPERDKMKLPTYKPQPPSLLASLTGRVKKAENVDMMEASGTSELLDRDLDFAAEDLDFGEEEVLTTETTEPALDETYSFEVPLEEVAEERMQESEETFEFSEAPEEIEEVELSTIESDEDLSLDIEELAIEEPEAEPTSVPSAEDEIVLDSDLITVDEDIEATPASEPPSLEEETVSLELEDLIEAEPDIQIEEQEAVTSLGEEETVSIDTEEQPLVEQEMTLEEQEAEASFDMDKTISLDLKDLPQDEPEITVEEEPEFEGKKEEAILSMEDLKEEEIESIISDSEVSTAESEIDQELDLALDEDTLSTDELPMPAETSESDEDFSIDLDSLDLDLELEEPEDK